MSHADVEMPDEAIVVRLAGVLREARDLADLIIVRPHLNAAAGPWLQQVILGATQAHESAESVAVESDAPVIHRARMLQDYIWTHGGGVFYPQDPAAKEVNLNAIAHSLSLKCRWTGHPKRLYTVGEHTLHVAEIAAFLAENRPEVTPEQAVVYSLVHDGHEAYLPDVARPIARYLDASLVAMAAAVQDTILEALDLPPPSAAVEAVVKEADGYALRLEGEVLFPHEDHDPDVCNLRNLSPPLEVRERFPVWDGPAPTCESIRDQWLATLTAAIAALKERRLGAEGIDCWEDTAKRVETPETCMVCAVEGKYAPAESDGLCAGCLNG
jgi:hypothetical protein